MRKILNCLLAVMLVTALLSGCRSGSTSTTNSKQVSSSSTLGSSDAVAMPTTPITFSVYYGEQTDQTDNRDSPVIKKIAELTGVTLRIETAVSDIRQKVSLMAASGELPDMIYAKTYLNLLLDINGVEKLDDLIEKYGPNIKKLYGSDLKRLKWSTEKPYIYCLGDTAVGNEDGDPVNGFCIQHAVVKEEGYPKIKTLADYENVLKTYYAKHPTYKGTDGKEQPTIPLLLNGYDWGYYISIGNPANFATGYADDEWAIDQNTFDAKRHIITDSNKE